MPISVKTFEQFPLFVCVFIIYKKQCCAKIHYSIIKHKTKDFKWLGYIVFPTFFLSEVFMVLSKGSLLLCPKFQFLSHIQHCPSLSPPPCIPTFSLYWIISKGYLSYLEKVFFGHLSQLLPHHLSLHISVLAVFTSSLDRSDESAPVVTPMILTLVVTSSSSFQELFSSLAPLVIPFSLTLFLHLTSRVCISGFPSA